MADPLMLVAPALLALPSLYLGAGRHRLPGWHHLDRHPFDGIDTVHDATTPLPFPDHTFGRVYSQDFLEHLPTAAKVPLMNEIWRVLAPGGTMEHYAPNAGSRNDFGSPSHLSHWNLQQFEHFDVDSYRYAADREYEGFQGGFKKLVAEEVNPLRERGIPVPQSIHVVYQAVAPC